MKEVKMKEVKMKEAPVVNPTAPRDCEHGQLARSCNICELQAVLSVSQATLRALNAVLSRDSLDELIDTATPHISAADVSPTAFGMGEVARSGAEKFRDALIAKIMCVPNNQAYNLLDEINDVLEQVRQAVRLTRATPATSINTLCEQIDRIIGKAEATQEVAPQGPVLYAAMWPPNTASVMKAIEDIASSLDLAAQDRFYSLVLGFSTGKIREIRTELFSHLLD
jgi:hypothetical protein